MSSSLGTASSGSDRFAVRWQGAVGKKTGTLPLSIQAFQVAMFSYVVPAYQGVTAQSLWPQEHGMTRGLPELVRKRVQEVWGVIPLR